LPKVPTILSATVHTASSCSVIIYIFLLKWVMIRYDTVRIR